jgi:hypothetical protein
MLVEQIDAIGAQPVQRSSTASLTCDGRLSMPVTALFSILNPNWWR